MRFTEVVASFVLDPVKRRFYFPSFARSNPFTKAESDRLTVSLNNILWETTCRQSLRCRSWRERAAYLAKPSSAIVKLPPKKETKVSVPIKIIVGTCLQNTRFTFGNLRFVRRIETFVVLFCLRQKQKEVTRGQNAIERRSRIIHARHARLCGAQSCI